MKIRKFSRISQKFACFAKVPTMIYDLVCTLQKADTPHPWALGLGLALTSCGWWEAYLPYDNALVGRPLFAYLR